MADQKQVVYECEVCETEITISSRGKIDLNPIYCCGLPITVKKAEKKVTRKKTDQKKPVQKSKPAAKGKTKKAVKPQK